jgi:hypothetical protein
MSGAANMGGALYARSSGVLTANTWEIVGGQFMGNAARDDGGAIVVQGATVTMTAVTFDGNTAGRSGGVLMNQSDGGRVNRVTALRSTFTGSMAGMNGSVIASAGSSGSNDVQLTNSRMYGNSVLNAAVIGVTSGARNRAALMNTTVAGSGVRTTSTLTGTNVIEIINSILWGTSTPIRSVGALTAAVRSSIVQGGYTGTGVINANPLFVDQPTGDLRLRPGSPGLDAGTNVGAPSVDIRGLPRPVNGIVDIGAYESRGYTLTLGPPQSTVRGVIFGRPLVVTVTAAPGEPSFVGAAVQFTPPPSGAGLSVAAPFSRTLTAAGVVTAAASANLIGGSYVVTVTMRGAPTQFYSLTNGQPIVLFVDHAAKGVGTGMNWLDAYRTLQSALAVATPGTQVWVAKGVYTPGVGITATFAVPAGVRVFGGFVSGSDAPDPDRNVTVLSGDLDNNDGKDSRGIVTSTARITGANALHVVTFRGEDLSITGTTRLRGFVVTAGWARGSTIESNSGGGVLCVASGVNGECSPVLEGMIFRGNRAGQGGALYITASSGAVARPVVTMTVIQSNTAGYGGAIASVGGVGGSVMPRLVNLVLLGNQATYGGALYQAASSSGSSTPRLMNVTIAGNRADLHGSAIRNEESAGALQGLVAVAMTNTIVWGNHPVTRTIDQGALFSSRIQVVSSVVQNYAATGASNVDPLFVSQVKGDLRLLPGSPAIDAGVGIDAPFIDVRGGARPVHGRFDIGAYEMRSFDMALGAPMTTMRGTSFARPLVVTVSNSAGEPVGPGGVVIFTPPASGPGLSTSAPFTRVTNAAGVVTATIRANNTAGTYVVTVTVRGVSAAQRYTLTNTAFIKGTDGDRQSLSRTSPPHFARQTPAPARRGRRRRER